jgi:hypothetical protein
VCRFHVAAGAKLRPGRGAIYKLSGAIVKLASINLRKLVLSPTGSINLGFILRDDLLLCSSYLPLVVPNWAVIYTPSPTTRGRGPTFINPPSFPTMRGTRGLGFVELGLIDIGDVEGRLVYIKKNSHMVAEGWWFSDVWA